MLLARAICKNPETADRERVKNGPSKNKKVDTH